MHRIAMRIAKYEFYEKWTQVLATINARKEKSPQGDTDAKIWK